MYKIFDTIKTCMSTYESHKTSIGIQRIAGTGEERVPNSKMPKGREKIRDIYFPGILLIFLSVCSSLPLVKLTNSKTFMYRSLLP